MTVRMAKGIGAGFGRLRRALLRGDGQLLLLAILLFSVLPDLDLWASAPFFDAQAARFPRHRLWVDLLYHGASALALLTMLALAAAVLVQVLRLRRQRDLMSAALTARRLRRLVFVLLALLLGPGLIVNEGFKEHWGRARPRQIEAFGGRAQFTPPTVPAAQCGSNCSFVSGHAAIGFGLMAFGWVSTRRRLWLALGIGSGALIGLARIAAGGHFLSDVIFSGFVVWFSMRLAAHLFAHACRSWRRRERRAALAAPAAAAGPAG